MWLVTGVALHISGVVLGSHLRERYRLGEIRLVTPCTQHGGIRQLRDHRCRVCRMLCERTVASFAIHTGMLACFFRRENVAVAVFTGGMSCEPGLARRNFL